VFLNTNSGVFPNGQEIRNSFNSPWADYVRVLRSECAVLLGYMFSDFKKRYCGDEWIVQTLDFCLQAVDDSQLNEELQIGVQFNSVTASTMNNLYRSTFLSPKDQVLYRDTFITAMDWITQMIDEADDATTIKEIKRKTTVQNLIFMMTHGIKTYEQAVAAVQLMNDEYKSGNAIIDDVTYKNACEGFRKVNVEIRHKILTQIIDEVLN
jgi:hypothetical protein